MTFKIKLSFKWIVYILWGGTGMIVYNFSDPLAECFHISDVSFSASVRPYTKHPLTRLCRRCVSSVLCANRCVSVLQQVSPSAACSRLSRRVWVSRTDQTWHTDWPHCSFLEKNRHPHSDMNKKLSESLEKNMKVHTLHKHTHILFSLVGESLCEFVEGSCILGLYISSTPQKLGEIWELLLFHLHLRV